MASEPLDAAAAPVAPAPVDPAELDALLADLVARTGGRAALRPDDLAAHARHRRATPRAGDEDTCVLCDAPNDVCDPCDAGDITCTGQRDIVCVTCDTADTCTSGDLCTGSNDVCVACDTARDPCTVADVL